MGALFLALPTQFRRTETPVVCGCNVLNSSNFVFRGLTFLYLKHADSSHKYYTALYHSRQETSKPGLTKVRIVLSLGFSRNMLHGVWKMDIYFDEETCIYGNKVKLFLCTLWRCIVGVEVQLHAFLTSTLGRGECSTWLCRSFKSREDFQLCLQ
jgi:hypothetical protein